MKTILLLLNIILLPPSAFAADDGIVVIVNEKNAITQLTNDQVTDYFLKKKRQWPDGTSVRFIDQMDDTDERNSFLHHFIKKTSREIDLFWIGQKLYTGDSEPMQVATDPMMASLVGKIPGAIGYLASTFPLPKGVKKIEVTGP